MPQLLANSTLADGANLVVGTTTGSKIATGTTQKLGFYNATPVVQPAGDLAAALGALGLISGPTAYDQLASLVSPMVSLAGATALTSTAFGKYHVCSGTSVSYTVTLPNPAGNAGKSIGLMMSGALTKLVTIAPYASETIDGAAARILWANETAHLLCDGTNWIKVAGKSIPMAASMTMSAGATIVNNTLTWVAMNSTISDNTGLMADPTVTNRINIPRKGIYLLGSYGTMIASGNGWIQYGIGLSRIGVGTVTIYTPSGQTLSANVVSVSAANPNDYVELYCQQTGGASATLYQGSTNTSIRATEVISW